MSRDHSEEEGMFKHHLIGRTLTGGLVIAAVGLPGSAQAGSPRDQPVARSTASIRLPDTPYSLRARTPGGSASDAVQPSSQYGFQWADAGIGAAGAVVLLGGAAAAAGMASRRRIQRTGGG
jgi:hypothetical protein